MMITFQVTQILNRIIKKLKSPIDVKGTNTEEFRAYQKIFNSLSDTDKKFILRNILYSRGRLVRHGFDNKESVHLEGLGTFKYKKDREMFFNKVHEKIEAQGYDKVSEVPKELKLQIVNEANKELNEFRINSYFERLKVNREKRAVPKPISIKLNNGGKW